MYVMLKNLWLYSLQKSKTSSLKCVSLVWHQTETGSEALNLELKFLQRHSFIVVTPRSSLIERVVFFLVISMGQKDHI